MARAVGDHRPDHEVCAADINADDIPRARDFYHERIGLDIMVSHYPGALFLSAGGYHHHLGVNTWVGPHAAPVPPDARLLYWGLVVPDVDAARTAVEGVAPSFAQLEVAPGTWDLHDPWQTVLRIRSDAAA